MNTSKKISSLLIGIMLASIGAGYAAGYFVYKQYTVKTAEMERQSGLNYEKLQKELKEFYVTLENTIDENKMDRARFTEHIEKIKEDLKGWEKGYRESLAGLQTEIENLKVDRLTYMVEKLQEDIPVSYTHLTLPTKRIV